MLWVYVLSGHCASGTHVCVGVSLSPCIVHSLTLPNPPTSPHTSPHKNLTPNPRIHQPCNPPAASSSGCAAATSSHRWAPSPSPPPSNATCWPPPPPCRRRPSRRRGRVVGAAAAATHWWNGYVSFVFLLLSKEGWGGGWLLRWLMDGTHIYIKPIKPNQLSLVRTHNQTTKRQHEKVHQEIVRRFQRLLSSTHANGSGHASASTTPASLHTAASGSNHNGANAVPPMLGVEEAQDLVHVERTVLHYGKGEENPVLAMRFLDFPNNNNGSSSSNSGSASGAVRVARQVSQSQVGASEEEKREEKGKGGGSDRDRNRVRFGCPVLSL